MIPDNVIGCQRGPLASIDIPAADEHISGRTEVKVPMDRIDGGMVVAMGTTSRKPALLRQQGPPIGILIILHVPHDGSTHEIMITTQKIETMSNRIPFDVLGVGINHSAGSLAVGKNGIDIICRELCPRSRLH